MTRRKDAERAARDLVHSLAAKPAATPKSDGPEQFTQPADVLLWLSEHKVEVTPGDATRVKVNLRNVGSVVETYTLTALGPASPWVVILPARISLFPGDEGSATVMMRPSRNSAMPAGRYVIGIMATSEVRGTDRAVGEIEVTLNTYYTFKSSIGRPTINIRRKASTFVNISNDGNSRITYHIEVVDPDGRLITKVDHPTVTLDPGEPAWVKIHIKAGWHLVGSVINRGVVVTTTAVKDETIGAALTEIKPILSRATVSQRSLLHLRLGCFGRMAIIGAVLGLLAIILIPRLLNAFLPPSVSGSPVTPLSFAATLDSQGQVVLTWDPSSGSTGYSIYAIGAAGNPVASTAPVSPSPASSPTSASASASASATATASTTATPSTSITPATWSPRGLHPGRFILTSWPESMRKKPSPSRTHTASPTATNSASAGSSSDLGTIAASGSALASIAMPLCSECSLVSAVPSGTTRYVIATPPPGINACYRIVAVADTTQSLFSPEACVETRPAPSGSPSASPSSSSKSSAAATDSKASSSASSSTSSASPSPVVLMPCPPIKTTASPISQTAIGLVWALPTSTESGTKKAPCTSTATITGFEVQQQLLTGWVAVSPSPLASETALQVSGLTPATEYCYRIRATAAVGNSAYSSTFCGTTPVATSATPSATTTKSSSSGTMNITPASVRRSAILGLPKRLQARLATLRTKVAASQRLVLKAQAQADAATQIASSKTEAAALAVTNATATQTRIDRFASVMYQQGEMSGFMSVLLNVSSPDAAMAISATGYVDQAASNFDELKAATTQAAAGVLATAQEAQSAQRTAQVLQGLAQQQLNGLQTLLVSTRGKLAAFMKSNGPQILVGPDGCPVSNPPGTLREGAEELGAAELCAASVAAASTPQAALALTFAFTTLGAPYACGGVGRLEPFRFDCSSLVSRAYSQGAGIPVANYGWAPSTRNMVPWDGFTLDLHYAYLDPSDVSPGDLVLYDTGGATFRHVVMFLADGYMLHTNACGDVAHISKFWGYPTVGDHRFLVARRILPNATYEPVMADPALTG